MQKLGIQSIQKLKNLQNESPQEILCFTFAVKQNSSSSTSTTGKRNEHRLNKGQSKKS